MFFFIAGTKFFFVYGGCHNQARAVIPRVYYAGSLHKSVGIVGIDLQLANLIAPFALSLLYFSNEPAGTILRLKGMGVTLPHLRVRDVIEG